MHIAAGSEDGRVIVWNLNSRAVVMEKQCHEKPVMAVAVHPTCKVIATGSLEPDVSIKIHTF
jgi:COMPASS component SWD3